jgi:bifunctional non-homologous end joining protein LigD
LAIPVNGHPLSWAEFSGTIKEGHGSGTVTIWDKGYLEWETEQPPLNFILKGNKLRGRYSLMPIQDSYLFYRIE